MWGWVEKGVQSLHKEASEYVEVMPSSTATTLQGRAMHHPLHPPTMEVTSSAPRPAYSQPPINQTGGCGECDACLPFQAGEAGHSSYVTEASSTAEAARARRKGGSTESEPFSAPVRKAFILATRQRDAVCRFRLAAPPDPTLCAAPPYPHAAAPS